jgi:hypothetical protein
LLLTVLLIIAIVIEESEIAMSFWFSFPLWLRILNISLCIYLPFVSVFENCLFSSFAYLFNGLLILCRVSFLSSLCILLVNLLSDI